MFSIRVNWPTGVGFPAYSMYSANKYLVNYLDDGVQVLLDGDQQGERDIRLANGATAYVMNGGGHTIDVIRTE